LAVARYSFTWRLVCANHLSLCPPHPPALPTLLQYYCTTNGQYTPPRSTSRVYDIHHTILAMTISCKCQPATSVPTPCLRRTHSPLQTLSFSPQVREHANPPRHERTHSLSETHAHPSTDAVFPLRYVSLAFTRYSFTSSRLCMNQSSLHSSGPPALPTLLQYYSTTIGQ